MEPGTVTEQIWFEDFVPGTKLISASRTVTIADIDAWAELTGERHPVHMDAAFARAAGFRGRIAHGLFSLALIEGLKAEMGGFEASVIASLGWDKVSFRAPLEPGDEVHAELELMDRRETSKPERGVVTERGSLLRADGTLITTGEHKMILRFRPATAAVEGSSGT